MKERKDLQRMSALMMKVNSPLKADPPGGSDFKSIGSYKNEKGVTIHAYQSDSGKTIYKAEKQGQFSTTNKEAYRKAEKYQQFKGK